MLLLRVIFPVILILLTSTSTEQTSETLLSHPDIKNTTTSGNCKNIRDYKPCLKNTCPEYMPCYCKDEKEYCRCTNFKGPLGDYWNLGAKCEQQWNTLDLILIAVIPGVCLFVIFAVCVQCVYSCKKLNYIAKANKRKELIEKKITRTCPVIISNHQNAGFLNDEDDGEDLSSKHQNTIYPPRIPKVNTAYLDQEEQSPASQIMHIPKENISYHQPEMNIGRMNFSPLMSHANSSHHEHQHAISQYSPLNEFPELGYEITPAIAIKRPEVLSPVGPRPSYQRGQLFEDLRHQQSHNPVRYGRPQY
ncbi:uncharacterized protein zgc:158432 [Stegostoma tigrinum]|uniref:uncharacterized protein zgc:158432 n=1 Tax=Stegostoma tigrinum TaxID=3053191 RepID=UPI00202B441C|nr:uncharacterized protein zgc:158432 [Stegostoma tigrinum]